eukprot:m.238783 g.238783  ORF g.238783 m.238783 type:complete len:239 (+) comp54362_c0_seq7:46-762(+)
MGSWLRFAVAIACMIQFGTCAPCQEAQCDTSSSTENLCSHKNLQAVPTCIPLSATVIDIGFNQLTGLDSNSFSRFSNLTRLFIHNNPITFLDPSTFASLSALQVIWMNDLLINDFPTGIFTSCANLRELVLSNNAITSLDGSLFLKLTRLETIDMSGLAISALPTGLFVSLTALTSLYTREILVPFPLSLTSLCFHDISLFSEPSPTTVCCTSSLQTCFPTAPPSSSRVVQARQPFVA